MKRILPYLVLSVLLIGCDTGLEAADSAGSPDADVLGVDQAAISHYFWDYLGQNNNTGLRTPQAAASTACRLGRNNAGPCSCVLVARTLVLTAAHCVRGRSEGDLSVMFPRASADPWPTVGTGYAPDPGYTTSGISFKWVGSAAREPFKVERIDMPYGARPGRGRDLALITLAESVPPEVVAVPAVVFTGNVGAWTENPSTTNPVSIPHAIAVGRGGIGQMRIGPLERVWGYHDSCGVFEAPDFCVNTCTETPEIRATENAHRWDVPLTEKGDSGGPMFLYSQSRGRYEVVGILSGARYCPDPDVAVWAHTGTLKGVNNAAVTEAVRVATGDDPDGDFLTGSADNCPSDFNPFQEDDDGDGVGDACDNCRSSKCLGMTTITCWNPSQTDTDGDEIGDACDLCPEHASEHGFFQSDLDGDEVGNECDWAPEHQIPFRRCTTNEDCASHHAGFCVIEAGDRNGRCSRQSDSDHDQVEDSIDLCVGDKDPTNRNTNWIAERLRNVAAMGDICDEVPVFRLEAQTNPTPINENPSRLQKEPFQGETMLGRNAPDDINARVVIRQCSCYTSPRSQRSNAQAEPDDYQCAKQLCDTDDAELARNNWEKITFERVTKDGAVLDLDDHFGSLRFQRGKPGSIIFFNWLWPNDIDEKNNLQGVDSRQLLPIALYRPSSGTNGLLATVVTGRVPDPESENRDQKQQLRVSTNRFFTPNVIVQEKYPFNPSPYWNDLCIQNPGCNLWIWKWQYAIAWPLNPNYRPDQIVDPIPAVAHRGRLEAFNPSGGMILLSASMDLLMHAIDFDQVAWIPPSESPDRLTGNPFWAQAIGLNRWEAGDPVMVAPGGGGLDLLKYSEIWPTSGRQPLRLEEGVRALYSGAEDRIYLVGWNNELGPAIRSYDLFAGRWDDLDWIDSLAPERPPLAAAYDSVSRKLYVLQVDDGLPPGQEHVRLIEHDLARKTSTMLRAWVWSYPGEQYQLAVLPDRRLALIRSAWGRYSVCGCDPSGPIAFQGMATGIGSPTGFPSVSRNGVQFLLYDPNDDAFDNDIGFRTVAVHQNEWDPRASCPSVEGTTW